MPISDSGVYILFDSYVEGVDSDHQLVLSETGNMREAASRIFSFLRRADAMDVKEIYACKVPEQGLGLAINDRLERAAAR